MTFTANFSSYAYCGDSIACEVDGFTVTARIETDDYHDRPDQQSDGFWPSLDPTDAGHIGKKSTRTLARRIAKAQAIMAAWNNDEWWYCGVCLTVEREGVQLTGPYNNALWGVECNYPGSDNSYLRKVANELLDEALADARAMLAKLCKETAS